MKKYIIIGIFVCGMFSAWSQDINTEKENVLFGVKAGWLQSSIYGADLDKLALDGKVNKTEAYFAGVSVYNPIYKYFALKHELYYQKYGANFKRDLEDHVFNASLEMHSLRLNPLNLTLKAGGFQLFAGPYVNMLLAASITSFEEGKTYRDKNIFGTEDEDTEEYKYLQKMDYGFVTGIEYRFEFGLFLGANYTKGYATLFDNGNTYGLEENTGMRDLKIYNKSIGVYIGYYF